MSQIVLAGTDVTFNAGMQDYSCQYWFRWRFFGLTFYESTNSLVRVPNISAQKAGQFSVIVSNISGTVTSSNAFLTVVSGPEPSMVSARPGTNVTFRVAVDGFGPVRIQWRLNAEEIPGATSLALSLTNIDSSSVGNYDAVVSNPAGTLITPAAVLSLEAPPPRLWGVVSGPDGCRFQVTAQPLAVYHIEAAEDIRGGWTEIGTYSVPSSGTFTVWDSEAPGFSGRCYRAFQH